MKARALAGMALVVSGTVLLCALGGWQIQRLNWKNDIIARLDQARAAPREFTANDLRTLGAEKLPLAYGTVAGRLLSDKDILLGPKTNDAGTIGYHLITPLALADGGTVLVHRGWVPEAAKKTPGALDHLAAKGTVSFTGIVRKPDWNGLTSGNSPAQDLWFRTDIAEIAAARQLQNAAPVMVYAETASRAFGSHVMNPPGWGPRNQHLQYAAFWFGMAGVLVLLTALLIARRRKTA